MKFNKNFLNQKDEHLPEKLKPFALLNSQDKNLILLFHGMSAYPWEMSFLGKFLYQQKYSVYAPLVSDFQSFSSLKKFSYKIWLHNIEAIMESVASQFKKITIIGHSLGGLLAIYASLHFSNVHKLILVNTVFKLNNPFIPFLPLVFPFWKGLPIKTIPKYQENYFPYFPSQTIYELYKLAALMRNSAKQIKIPTLVIGSQTDKTISLKATQKFYNNLNSSEKKIKIYAKAPHSILTPVYKNRTIVYQEILKFLGGK